MDKPNEMGMEAPQLKEWREKLRQLQMRQTNAVKPSEWTRDDARALMELEEKIAKFKSKPDISPELTKLSFNELLKMRDGLEMRANLSPEESKKLMQLRALTQRRE